MAGSGEETDPISGKKLTSRLNLRKKKYPPPFEDPKNKDTEDVNINQEQKIRENCIKTNTSNINTSNTNTSKTNTSKTCTTKTFAEIVGGSRKTGIEDEQLTKASAKEHSPPKK